MDYSKEYCINGKRYRINEQHRRGNPRKSQWTVKEDNELDIFACSLKKNWVSLCQYYSYGLLIRDNVKEKLGESIDKQDLYIAKFICNQNLWHGYPCGDKPEDLEKISDNTLQSWKDYFSKKEILRMLKGQKI